MNKKLAIITMSVLLVLGGAFVAISLNSQASSEEIKLNKYTMQDVANHHKLDDCWTIINGNVYDITSYVPIHAGGEEILQSCGLDSTNVFMGIDSKTKAPRQFSEYLIGVLQT
jgi:cytochrome b involved in lipid metabolism